jgi:hypothetical protein
MAKKKSKKSGKNKPKMSQSMVRAKPKRGRARAQNSGQRIVVGGYISSVVKPKYDLKESGNRALLKVLQPVLQIESASAAGSSRYRMSPFVGRASHLLAAYRAARVKTLRLIYASNGQSDTPGMVGAAGGFDDFEVQEASPLMMAGDENALMVAGPGKAQTALLRNTDTAFHPVQEVGITVVVSFEGVATSTPLGVLYVEAEVECFQQNYNIPTSVYGYGAAGPNLTTAEQAISFSESSVLSGDNPIVYDPDSTVWQNIKNTAGKAALYTLSSYLSSFASSVENAEGRCLTRAQRGYVSPKWSTVVLASCAPKDARRNWTALSPAEIMGEWTVTHTYHGIAYGFITPTEPQDETKDASEAGYVLSGARIAPQVGVYPDNIVARLYGVRADGTSSLVATTSVELDDTSPVPRYYYWEVKSELDPAYVSCHWTLSTDANTCNSDFMTTTATSYVPGDYNNED